MAEQLPRGGEASLGRELPRCLLPQRALRERSVTLRCGPVPTGQIGEWRLREGCELPRVSMAWNWAF